MPALNPTTRGLLEKAVIAARDAAENAAASALERLAVNQKQPYETLTDAERRLRKELIEEAGRLGDAAAFAGPAKEILPRLIAECAYEQWHRILFARFLAENRLLIHPEENIPVTLALCQELARDEGAPDGWMLAARYAQKMLPGIFRNDDPVLQVQFAPENRQELQRLAAGLPVEVFTSDDGLGWVYQFWQTKRKEQVNKSGEKVGGDDICAVTQLFTEPYMVQFLLHNSLGAWWVNRHPGEPLPIQMDYLRLNEDGTPAAGGFEGWPNTAAEITIIDPCCGSGHFLVAAFEIMVAFRKAEEGLGDAEAGDVVIRDNIHGLELDPRCTQIAAFNIALTAWKDGGYRNLPLPHIACSGLTLGGTESDWTKLADLSHLSTVADHADLRTNLKRLHESFCQGHILGSLIDPEQISQDESLLAFRWETIAPLLEHALNSETLDADPVAKTFGHAMVGIARSSRLLSSKYTLVATNVPYLGRDAQPTILRTHCAKYFPVSNTDLATSFVERCIMLCNPGGTSTTVTPQNWLFLTSYRSLRVKLLEDTKWDFVCRLGSGAFETISGQVVNVILVGITRSKPIPTSEIAMIDASSRAKVDAKSASLLSLPAFNVLQNSQLTNPDSRIVIASLPAVNHPLLSQYATAYWGQGTGDFSRFGRMFWEPIRIDRGWDKMQSTVESTRAFGGREYAIFWEDGKGELVQLAEELRLRLKNIHRRGSEAWNNNGVSVSQMSNLPVTLYTGQIFDGNCASIRPKDPKHLAAIWVFCSSPGYNKAVRRIDQKLSVTNATLVKIPFDLEYWQKVADEKYPNGLPEPHSDDPTQWLFKGDVVTSENPLHVAVARLLGYRWPDQEPDALDELADADGIVCIPPASGEQPAARRLEELLARAYGDDYSPQIIDKLLAADTFPAKDLETWLRDNFFQSHCRLFHNRPFLWHIWDGHKQGFSVIVNYHKLDARNLEKLIYHYLGSWIRDLRIAVEREETGAEDRLVKALDLQKKLEAILYGEDPHDIFVRWKAGHEQPIGWNPDLNDGVRLNIRPFFTIQAPGTASDKGAGVLRSKFTINWNKDRGKNPDNSERHNDIHLTRAAKDAARLAHAEKVKAQEEAAALRSAANTGNAMDPPAEAVAGETDLFGVPVQKDLFGNVVG